MKKYIVIILLFFSCQGKTPFSLGNNYSLDYDGNSFYAIYDYNKTTDTKGIVIKGDILEINNDSTFIIVFVKPVYKIMKMVNPNNTLKLSEENKLIANSKIREYWILNKKMKSELKKDNKGNYYLSNVFGPYNFKQYKKKRKELNISEKLNLIPILNFLNNNH